MFEYTNEWAEEIYALTKKVPTELKEKYYLADLYAKANSSKDIRVVAALIKCLEVPSYGFEETIIGTLSTIEYKLYYEAVFKYGPLLFESLNDDDEVPITLLDWKKRDLTEQELQTIKIIADKHLNKKHIQKYIDEMDEYGEEYQEEEPYGTFYKYFKNRLKE